MVQRSLSVSPSFFLGDGLKGGEEEGEESREESSGGNCEEKMDGEHSVGEIGENACG